jgi:sulfite exporter TauE/SafE
MSRLDGSLQEVTYGISVTCQLVAHGLVIAALAQNDVPEVLRLILILELVVGVLQTIWYAVVGVLYVCRTDNALYDGVAVSWRYIDWVFTTPVMLLSLLFYTVWESNRYCTTTSDLVGTPLRVASIPTVLIMNWLMLYIGFVYETRHEDSVVSACFCSVAAARWLDKAASSCTASSTTINDRGLYFGFIPYIVVFALLFAVLGEAHSPAAAAAIVVIFVVWALYGVVAVGVGHEDTKHISYNLLDIVSKNVVAIVIATVSLTGDFSDDGYAANACTTVT